MERTSFDLQSVDQPMIAGWFVWKVDFLNDLIYDNAKGEHGVT
jgi:hypothetical protein